MAKIDVSDVSMRELQQVLPQIEWSLCAVGYGLYSIDYTQNFLGSRSEDLGGIPNARPTSFATRTTRTTLLRKTPHHPEQHPQRRGARMHVDAKLPHG